MIDIDKYLRDNDYASVEEWALDSDYRYDKNTDTWFDEENYPVDIEEKLWYAIEAMSEDNL